MRGEHPEDGCLGGDRRAGGDEGEPSTPGEGVGVRPAEGLPGKGLEPGLALRPLGRRLELEVEVRPTRVARCPDEADLLAGGEARACDDLRVENGEMAVRPDLPVVRTEGQTDPAGRMTTKAG